MKLSVFAVLLAAKPFDEACKYLANAGVQAVEIGCGGFPGKAHCDPKEFLAHPDVYKRQVLARGGVIWRASM